jgi:hypothetical protein
MGRRSKIEKLPDTVRTEIDRLLIKAGFSGYEWLVDQIRDELGVDPGEKSSVQRYGSKLQRRLAAVKASTDAARMIAEAAPDEADERSNAIISLVQTEIFDSLLAMQEAEEEANPAKRVEMLGKAAKNIATLTRASVARHKWASEVRARIEAALAKLKQQGMDGATLDAVQSQISIYLPANNR